MVCSLLSTIDRWQQNVCSISVLHCERLYNDNLAKLLPLGNMLVRNYWYLPFYLNLKTVVENSSLNLCCCLLQMNSKGESKKGTGGLGSKNSPLLEEQTVVTYVTVPPDGGWGWVIVAASFFCNFCVDGIVYSAGVFVGRIDKSLNVSKASVALMGSLLAGFCLMSGYFCFIGFPFLLVCFGFSFVLAISFDVLFEIFPWDLNPQFYLF